MENTIQGKLERLLSRLLEMPIEVYGAGRTDAGVHALGQTASFQVPEENLRVLAMLSADRQDAAGNGGSIRDDLKTLPLSAAKRQDQALLQP